MKNKLNLGCGKDIKKGYINLDKIGLKGVDTIHDIEKTPYPFKDNIFIEINCNHILEHTSNLIEVMEEIYRISDNKAIIYIRVPYFANPEHHNDPTHKRKFTYNTIDYFTNNSFFNYYTTARFEIIDRKIFFLSGKKEFMQSKSAFMDFLININPKIYQRFFAYIFPAAELQIKLKVNK